MDCVHRHLFIMYSAFVLTFAPNLLSREAMRGPLITNTLVTNDGPDSSL